MEVSEDILPFSHRPSLHSNRLTNVPWKCALGISLGKRVVLFFSGKCISRARNIKLSQK